MSAVRSQRSVDPDSDGSKDACLKNKQLRFGLDVFVTYEKIIFSYAQESFVFPFESAICFLCPFPTKMDYWSFNYLSVEVLYNPEGLALCLQVSNF